MPPKSKEEILKQFDEFKKFTKDSMPPTSIEEIIKEFEKADLKKPDYSCLGSDQYDAEKLKLFLRKACQRSREEGKREASKNIGLRMNKILNKYSKPIHSCELADKNIIVKFK